MPFVGIDAPWIGQKHTRWIELVQEMGHRIEVPRDGFIVRQGDVVDGLYCLTRGLARYQMALPCGDQLSTLLVMPGSLLGEPAVLSQETCSVAVQALVDSEVYRLPRMTVLEALHCDPGLAIDMVLSINAKFRGSYRGFSMVHLRPPRERLIGLWKGLLANRELSADQVWVPLPYCLSHAQIGSIIGVGRVTVCRMINSLREEGLVIMRARRMYIHRDLLLTALPCEEACPDESIACGHL